MHNSVFNYLWHIWFATLMPIQSGSLDNNPTGLSILTTLKWSKTSIVGELTIKGKHVCKQRYYLQMEIIPINHYLTFISLFNLFIFHLLFPYIQHFLFSFIRKNFWFSFGKHFQNSFTIKPYHFLVKKEVTQVGV